MWTIRPAPNSEQARPTARSDAVTHPDASPVLRLQGVTRRFSSGKGQTVTALDALDLHIRPARVTGLIGPDGAGKTTLMRLAAGLLMPDEGSVHVLDLDTTRQALDVQSSVGYMPQRFGLYEDLSVQENLDLYADLQALEKADRPTRYRELMHMTGLAPFTGRLAGKLSGGMKQKLGLACALLRPPRLLLLDEPTVGVDPVSRRELWSIVYRQVEELGMSVLLSTAYLDEAERCDEVVLLHNGRLLGQDTPRSFSEPLRGRVFTVGAEALGKRRLQARLYGTAGVIDSIIAGERVRIITDGTEVSAIAAGFDAGEGVSFEPADPVFEDAFMARLYEPDAAGTDPPVVAASGSRPSTQSDAVIEVKRLQKRFGDFYAVRDVSFSVRPGEIFGLLGANGAGKSTTFRMLCGLLPASGGEVRVAGLDLRHAMARARGRLGYMAQRFSLYTDLTVVQNLNFFASAYGLDRRRKRSRIDWALQAFELHPYVNSDSGTLPLGYKQRLAMAAALLHEPDILFLDEPTSGVDPLARREFWRRINALAEQGVTVLVTTHFMEEANYCDRLVIMADGELLAAGTPEKLKQDCRSEAQPDPSMEDAFIALIEAHTAAGEAAA
jgi:ABC-2 type transport system ATP-binding protein